MADTSIEWADRVWNPTTGCDRVSPGCDHCYALTMAKRLKGMGSAKYQQDGDPRTSGPGFLATEHLDALTIPLRWRKPAKVFVNSMSDLFHDRISNEFIAQVFAVMAVTPRHTYQVLTKRHARMRFLLTSNVFRMLVCDHAGQMISDGLVAEPDLLVWAREPAETGDTYWIPPWPLPNVWAGVSVESQQWADIRIPALLDTPAAVRWLSCEPLLGPVDLGAWVRCQVCRTSHKFNRQSCDPHTPARFRAHRLTIGGDVDWVVVGGESGPGARPMHPDWARSLRDQCRASGVPFLFKQWGEHAPRCRLALCGERCSCDGSRPSHGDPEMVRVGKKAAGRVLDGRTYDEYPQAWARPSREDTAAGAPNQDGDR